ncbi:hypothetical protein [Rhizobium leguminosarum]|jgi:hypothetical protein|uniref:hypothetical protein n=1 Tax=Rhizobium leguminosarum TaxID=384 RepID=UPI001441EBA7|nr:hypothetical protein [Rhizobium leguminosarum]MDV4163668.1 hypothetical protein [Rhizobium leguminosarum]MDV4173550.1 hypothetical protein [Rhizobium leguminosarum]
MSQFDAVFVSTLVPLLAATVVAYAVTILLLCRSTHHTRIWRRPVRTVPGKYFALCEGWRL